MKNIISILILLCMTNHILAAAYLVVDDIRYKFINDTCVCVTYLDNKQKYSGNIVIPSYITTFDKKKCSVTSIGDKAFDECADLSSVLIPSSVKSIGKYAFRNCTGLSSIIIPNAVTYIDYGAFVCCSNLSTISMSKNVTYVGRFAFNGTALYNSYTGFVYIDNVLVGYNGDMPKNTKLIIKDGTTLISEESLDYKNLVSVTIPNSVTSICNYAFYGSGLKEVVFQDGTDTISVSGSSFNSCYSLDSLYLGRRLSKYSTLSTNAKKIVIGDNVTKLDNYIFRSCSSLKSVTLPKTIQYIDSTAFDGCNRLWNFSYKPTKSTVLVTNTAWGFNGCSYKIELQGREVINESISASGLKSGTSCPALYYLYIPETDSCFYLGGIFRSTEALLSNARCIEQTPTTLKFRWSKEDAVENILAYRSNCVIKRRYYASMGQIA